MKNILNERNTWHPYALRKCVKIVTILLSLLLLPTSINSETVTTGNILTNSTFGTGTTYSTDGWTVSDHTHGHHGTGSFATVGGGNNPGGSVAAEEDTIISQTVSLADNTNMITEEIYQINTVLIKGKLPEEKPAEEAKAKETKEKLKKSTEEHKKKTKEKREKHRKPHA